jgi:hypothetical protein
MARLLLRISHDLTAFSHHVITKDRYIWGEFG